MKLSEFYTQGASNEWFTTTSRRGSIHEKLAERGFSILSRSDFAKDYTNLTIPVNKAELSWGASLACPSPDLQTTFIAKYHYEFKKTEFNGQTLSDITSGFMQLMPGSEKYLVSLHNSSFLFAVNDKIEFDDVFTVARDWSIDCFIGVFDDSNKMSFVFDAEFGIAYFSFSPDCRPAGIEEFSDYFNAGFKNDFVQNGKVRTGADLERIAEYFEKIVLPVLR